MAKKRGSRLAEINSIARQNHMNYGKYTELERQKEMVSIEQMRKEAKSSGDMRYMSLNQKKAMEEEGIRFFPSDEFGRKNIHKK